MKQTVLNLMKATGAFAPFRIAHQRQALILTYHRFGSGGESDRVSARAFDEQLAYLVEHYTVVPLSELARLLARKAAPPPRLAAVTIDDGYSDAYEVAFPLLRRHRVPATVFVVTDFLDRKIWLWTDKLRFVFAHTNFRQFETRIAGHVLRLDLRTAAARNASAVRVNSLLKTLPDNLKEEAIHRLALALDAPLPALPPDEFGPIRWEQALEMEAAGVEMGSHTAAHPILTRVDDARLRRELVESRIRLESALRRRVELFCYPNGNYDGRVQREVAQAGYRCAVTCDNGLNLGGLNPLTLRRIHTEHDLARFIRSTSGFELAKNRLRRRLSFQRSQGRKGQAQKSPSQAAGKQAGITQAGGGLQAGTAAEVAENEVVVS